MIFISYLKFWQRYQYYHQLPPFSLLAIWSIHFYPYITFHFLQICLLSRLSKRTYFYLSKLCSSLISTHKFWQIWILRFRKIFSIIFLYQSSYTIFSSERKNILVLLLTFCIKHVMLHVTIYKINILPG